MLSLSVYPIHWFLIWGLFLIFLALHLLRLLFNYTDPNPFGRIGRFGFKIRRITERWVYPAARFFAGYRVDVRFAPLLVILIGFILTYFTSQMLWNAFFIIDGVSAAITTGNIKATIGFIIYGLLSLLVLLILIRFVSQWFVYTQNTLFGFARRVTDPIMLPFQRLIPTVGIFDISAMVVLIVIFILQAVVMRVMILT